MGGICWQEDWSLRNMVQFFLTTYRGLLMKRWGIKGCYRCADRQISECTPTWLQNLGRCPPSLGTCCGCWYSRRPHSSSPCPSRNSYFIHSEDNNHPSPFTSTKQNETGCPPYNTSHTSLCKLTHCPCISLQACSSPPPLLANTACPYRARIA